VSGPYRLGVYGGAFDPPHNAHRAVIEACRTQFGLDRVRVLPTGNHAFKGELFHAPAEVRLALCRLAFFDLPFVDVDDHELQVAATSYTVDTLRALRTELGPDVELYFLLGSDNVPDLPRWREHHAALALAQFVIVPRAGVPIDAQALAGLDLTQQERAGLLAHVAQVVPSPLSSTELRARLRAGADVSDALPPAVRREIARRGLYRG
jgi:nicotinate-nucleotide adenylyltransferase